MGNQQLLDLATRIQQDSTSLINLINAPVAQVVNAGENLQAALDKGGIIDLEDGAVFEGTYVARVPGTQLLGPKASLKGSSSGPALRIPAGTNNIVAVLQNAETDWDQSCIEIGDNTITNKDDLPTDITLTINIPRFLGKHAFSINGSVSLINCNALNVYDPAGRDSQAIGILNSSGKIDVFGGTFEAGSEVVLIGGARTGVADTVPTDIYFENVTLQRPASWKTDGVKRVVKNLFELKAGVNVTVKNSTMSGCWVDGQSGFAVMVTPRDGKTIGNVLFENVSISDVGNGFNVLGYDYKAETPQLVGFTLKNVSVTTNPTYGKEIFFAASASPKNVVIDGCSYVGKGTTVYVNPGSVWNNGVEYTDVIMEGFQLINSRLQMSGYGIMTDGHAYGLNWKDTLVDGVITNNTFTGITTSKHQNNLPDTNTFIS